jgi:hypothetical protein
MAANHLREIAKKTRETIKNKNVTVNGLVYNFSEDWQSPNPM